MNMAGKDGRSSIWAFLLYPESMPRKSFEYLNATNLPIYVSPLHDRDIMTLEDVIDEHAHGYNGSVVGQFKKPHYHVMIRFSSNKSANQVLFVLKPLGVKWVLQLGTSESADGHSWRGYARYLCHLDNPEKAQYDRKDVLVFHAPPYRSTAALNLAAQRSWELTPIFDIVYDNGIVSWQVLIDFLRVHEPALFELAMQQPSRVLAYMKSMCWTETKGARFALLGGNTTTPPQQIESESSSPSLLPEPAKIAL